MREGYGFSRALEQVERALCARLGLRPLPLEAALAQATGPLRGEPVRLSARAYSGPTVRYARVVTMEGAGLDIANLLVLAPPSSGAPMLGADLVGLSPERAVVAMDLTPVDADAEREGDAASVAPFAVSLSAQREGLLAPGPLPGWCQRWFSPHALFARLPPRDAPRGHAALACFADVWCALAEVGPEGRGRVPARAPAALAEARALRQAAYLRAHREEDAGLRLLDQVLTPPLARRWVREVLFPTDLPPVH